MEQPFEFSKAGLFSGSFWWRDKSYKDGYDDAVNRIMHKIIRNGKYAPWLKFFFECGALDETKDRNNNGIIDSIDDTLDLIDELKTRATPMNPFTTSNWKTAITMCTPGAGHSLNF